MDLNKKYERNFFKPMVERDLPAHPGLLALKPMLFVDKSLYANSKVWVHMYHMPKMTREECARLSAEPQVHDADEIHMCLGSEGVAKAKWILDDEEYFVESPSTTYIPAGVKHWNAWLEINEPITIAVVITSGERKLV
jgi:hypothetical protein